MSDVLPQPGEFVEVRGRRWLVEGRPMWDGVSAVRLACVDDDAQGEVVEVAWLAELDGWTRAEAMTTRGLPSPRTAPTNRRHFSSRRHARSRQAVEGGTRSAVCVTTATRSAAAESLRDTGLVSGKKPRDDAAPASASRLKATPEPNRKAPATDFSL